MKLWQLRTHAYVACGVCNASYYYPWFQIFAKGVSRLGWHSIYYFVRDVRFSLFFFFLHYIFERAVRIGCTRPFACTVARNPKCYSTGIIRPSIATKLPFELIRVSTAQRRHYRTTDAAIYLEIVTMPFSLNGIRSRYKVRSYCRWDEAEFPASNVHHWIPSRY